MSKLLSQKNLFLLLICLGLLSIGFVFSSSALAAEPKKNILLKVPFTTQAPLANWKDKRQQDGCEEAVALMAMAFVKGEGLDVKKPITKATWEKKITTLSDFEQKKYGEYRDVSLSDMKKWIFEDYFKYQKVSLKEIATTSDLVSELEKGRIILVPANGRALKNPYFTAPGPVTHMILIKGYDYQTDEFITNDPGTRRGENYRYKSKIVLEALRVYPTGYHLPVKKIEKKVIVVEK